MFVATQPLEASRARWFVFAVFGAELDFANHYQLLELHEYVGTKTFYKNKKSVQLESSTLLLPGRAITLRGIPTRGLLRLGAAGPTAAAATA